MKKFTLVFLLIILFANSSQAAWYNQAWNNRIKITVNKSQVNGSVSDFPVYINLDDLPDSFFDNCKNNGSDLRITLGDGSSELAREIVFVDKTANAGELWFKAPSLTSASNGNFYIYYGNSSATEPGAATSYGSQNVWSNGFVAVYHMNALTNGAASVLDSTSFVNHGTPVGGMSSGTDLISGRIGNAIDFDGTNDAINIGGSVSSQFNGNSFSVSLWDRRQSINSDHYMFGKNTGSPVNQNLILGYRLNNVYTFAFYGNDLDTVSTYTTTNTWRYWHATYNANSNSRMLYQDGNLNVSGTSSSDLTGTGTYFIGAAITNYYSGSLDELHIARKERNRNWIRTEYNNQNSPNTFYTVNGEESNLNASNFPHKHKITILAAKVNGDLENFPVYVNLDHLPNSFFSTVDANGADIRITTNDHITQVPFELVELDIVNRTGELWFRADYISSTTDTNFYLWYGNPNASAYTRDNQFGSENVWSNGYVGVWHLSEDPTTNIIDSTSYQNNGSQIGSMTNSDLVTGLMGSAYEFDGTDDYVQVSDHNSLDLVGTDFTVSAWAKPRPNPGQMMAVTKKNTAWSQNDGWQHYYISFWGGASGFMGYGTSFSQHYLNNYFDEGAWHYWATTGVYGGSTNIINYVDASSVGSNSVTNITNSTDYLWLGARDSGESVDGLMDEIRIANKARSIDWISAEFINQNEAENFYNIDNGIEDSFDSSKFPHKIKITINRSQVNGSVTEFPVYVNLDHMPSHFFSIVKSNGADIRITESDLVTRAPLELVSLDKATTNGELWFRASSLSSTANSDFYLWYGNNGATMPTASSPYGSQNVWSNGFVAVYHMNALTNGTASVLDSTSFANHGTPYGGMTAGSDLVTGRTGTGIDFDGVNDMIDINNDAELQIGSGTMSAWLKTADAGASDRGIVTKQAAYGAFLRSNIYNIYDWNTFSDKSSSQNLANNAWRYTAASFQSGIAFGSNLYTDGVLRASHTMTVLNQTVKLAIASGAQAPGFQFFTGNIDEVRIANKARNANWITTEYNNQNSPNTFYSITQINNSNSFWGVSP
ncbi:MAG: DUF2341 domain-containing protein [Candidatus Caenarcaniphilales bacterium]|jgi:hypothetical protein|nr:DUF2341 domain-containing protein [Candidatus Caenarcaniphilales bacterium]